MFGSRAPVLLRGNLAISTQPVSDRLPERVEHQSAVLREQGIQTLQVRTLLVESTQCHQNSQALSIIMIGQELGDLVSR